MIFSFNRFINRYNGLLAVLTFMMAGCNGERPDHLAQVNDTIITAKEFQARVSESRAETIKYFRDRYGVNYGDQFWNNEFGGEIPAEKLTKRVMEKLIKIKIELMIARDFKLIDDISYDGFLNYLDSENERRAEAIRQKKVIYGPVEYSEPVFYNYFLSNLRLEIKGTMEKELGAASPESLRKMYAGQKALGMWSVNEIKLELSGLKPSAEGEQSGGKTDCRSLESLERLRKYMAENQEAADVAQYVQTLGCQLVQQELIYSNKNPDNDAPDGVSDEIMQTAEYLRSGEISQPISSGEDYWIIRIAEKKELGFVPFEACQHLVKSAFVNARYDSLVQSRLKQARIIVDSEQLKNIAALYR